MGDRVGHSRERKSFISTLVLIAVANPTSAYISQAQSWYMVSQHGLRIQDAAAATVPQFERGQRTE